jgi:hypothetical protein
MNPRHPSRIAICLLAWLAARTAAATTYVMMADEDLADEAPVIAVVRVRAVEPAPVGGAPATEYRVEVERVVKGGAGDTLRIRVPGGTGPGGLSLRLFGMPPLRRGRARPSSSWSLGTTGLSAWSRPCWGRSTSGTRPSRAGASPVRDLTETTEIARPGRQPVGDRSARDFDRFVEWLAARAAGRVPRARLRPRRRPAPGPRFHAARQRSVVRVRHRPATCPGWPWPALAGRACRAVASRSSSPPFWPGTPSRPRPST